MLRQLLKVFYAPVFADDEEKTRKAWVLNFLAWATVFILPVLIVANRLGGNLMPHLEQVALALSAAMFIIQWFLRRGRVRDASWLWMVVLLLFVTGGLFDASLGRMLNVSVFFFAIVAAGILFHRKGIVLVTLYSSLAVLVAVVVTRLGYLPPLVDDISGWVIWLSLTGLYIGIAAFVFLSVNMFNQAVVRASVELAERRKSEADLRQRDEIFQAVHFAVQEFFSAADWRTSLPAVLARLGTVLQASHVYIFERHYLPGGKPALSQRYEWVTGGAPSALADPAYQNIDISLLESEAWYQTLARGETCQGNLNDFSAAEWEALVGQQVKALIEAPLVVGGKWWGVIGVDDFNRPRAWSTLDVETVKTVASTLSAAIQRQVNDLIKHQRDAIMQAATFAAQRFLKSADWQAEIQAVLAELGEATRSSHVYIFQNHLLEDGKPVTSQMYEWAAENVQSDLPNPLYQNMPLADPYTRHWLETMQAGEAYHGNLDTLSPEVREIYLSRGLLTFIDVPIIVKGQWWGIMGFDDHLNVRDWTPLEIEAIKIAASTLSMAIERQLNDAALRDSEARHLAELELRVQQRTTQLEEALREIEEVSYTASHDLRAPLRAVHGYASILLEEFAQKLDEEGQVYLNRIASEAQRMGRLLDDLLKLMRLNRAPLRLTRLDLSVMLAEIVSQRQEKAQPARDVRITIQPGLSVFADADLMKIVLAELLENACKFTFGQASPQIEFGEQDLQGEQVLFLRDNGIGFDMRYTSRLFRHFEQLSPPGQVEGTGMGLSTVQRIIHRHGGRVWLEGKPNAGATIYFTLPRR